VVVAFFVDVFIFKEIFSITQLLSAIFIVAVTITVVFQKLRAINKDKTKENPLRSPSFS